MPPAEAAERGREVFGVVNLTGGDHPADLSRPTDADSLSGIVTVNARVEGDPEVLADCVRRSLDTTATRLNINCEIKEFRALSPQRPVPRYRIAAAVEQTGRI